MLIQKNSLKSLVFMLVILMALGLLSWQVYQRLGEVMADKPKRSHNKNMVVPVQVAPIERGSIALERVFSGTLEAHAEFVVAPKVSGRLVRLNVDLADPIKRGQAIAEMDNAEYVQAVAQAEADLAVAKANLAEARSLLRIAERELKRIEQLNQRGATSASQRDSATAEKLAKAAHVQVTRAQIARAEAALETARIRLGYTQVIADWHGGAEQRVVAERYVDEGETVAAQTPLLRIVELDPISAIIHVTEVDYAALKPGLKVSLSTDAYAQQQFIGHIERISPVFQTNSRQARVEVRIANPEQQLKPGMFVRANVTLKTVENTTLIPLQALTRRKNQEGVFVLAAKQESVVWREVQRGIQQGERLQAIGEGLQGHVVILGQQLLKEGTKVILPSE